MIKLQNKTALRNKINNNFYTTLSLDNLHVYSDGSWAFHSCNSDVYHTPQYHWVTSLKNIATYELGENNVTNKTITEFFRQIEIDINK